MKDIILASTSVYRKEQLQRLRLSFKSVPPDVSEDGLKAQGLDHVELSRQLALLKARAVSSRFPDAIVIGGDQVASFDNETLSKPKTKERAVEQLAMLSGNEHRLITSLAIISSGNEYLHTSIAHMAMRDLSSAQIERYVDMDEPLQCCGSYRLEALGISLFEKIDCDDYTSIIGIPLMWTAKILSSLGVAVP